MKNAIAAASLLLALVAFARAQQQQSSQSDLNAVTESMSHGHHHDEMGPHMHTSTLRDPQPGDDQKAQEIAVEARQTLGKYKDYKTALDDGFTYVQAPQRTRNRDVGEEFAVRIERLDLDKRGM